MIDQQNPNPAEVFDQYFGPSIAVPWARIILEHASPKPSERVLDVACGTGYLARHIAPKVGGRGRVVALDVNPVMLAVGRGRHAPAETTIEWLEGNATALALPDNGFDLVVCQQGLQYLSDRLAGVREMRRVLTDGGRVVFCVWQSLQEHPLYEALYEAIARHLAVDTTAVALPFSLSDTEELHTLLSRAGLQHIDIIPHSLSIHLPVPERFVQLTVLGATGMIGALGRLDRAALSSLVEAVSIEIEPVLRPYCLDDQVSFPMSAHIAVAYK